MRFLYAVKPAAVVLCLQVTSYVSALSFRHAVTCYLYATCCLVLCGLPAYISERKKKEPMLPACHHLAKTHHVNFMTTACYCCQFFHSDSDSLGHPRKLTAFIFYGAAFVSFWQCQWKIQGDTLSYGSSPLMRPAAAGRWREVGVQTDKQTDNRGC